MATCQIRLDFFSSRAPVQPSDKTFVAQELDAYVGLGPKATTCRSSWASGARSGSRSMTIAAGCGGSADMLDLLARARSPFHLSRVSRGRFGIYRGYGTLPDPAHANLPLIELFTKQLASPARK